MKVVQPALYYCDLCNKQESKNEKIYKKVPVLSYSYYSTEWGVDKESATLVLREFDLCEGCLKKVVGIEYAENFCQPGFSFLKIKEEDPKEFKVNLNMLIKN